MNGSPATRSPELLSTHESLLLILDMQERLLPQINDASAIATACVQLLRVARLFEIPTCLTEQYPRGLGSTTPELSSLVPAENRREKLRFSAAPATDWPPASEREDARVQIVIAGIETHICVLQSALDFISLGYRVFVAANAVGSQNREDHFIALQRLRDAGASITTTQSVFFEWCEEAGTDEFRAMREIL